MSDANKVRTLVLEGSPQCTLHLPDAEGNRWIAGAVEARSDQVRRLVLVRYNSSSASAILIQALRNAGTLLQSK